MTATRYMSIWGVWPWRRNHRRSGWMRPEVAGITVEALSRLSSPTAASACFWAFRARSREQYLNARHGAGMAAHGRRDRVSLYIDLTGLGGSARRVTVYSLPGQVARPGA